MLEQVFSGEEECFEAGRCIKKRKVDTVFSVLCSPERWQDALLPHPNTPTLSALDMCHGGVRRKSRGSTPRRRTFRGDFVSREKDAKDTTIHIHAVCIR